MLDIYIETATASESDVSFPCVGTGKRDNVRHDSRFWTGDEVRIRSGSMPESLDYIQGFDMII